jgi:hypothetical protein
VKYEDSLLKLKYQMDLRGRAIQYLLESLSYQLLRFDFFDRLSLRFIRMEMEMDINWIVLCLDIKILCLCFLFLLLILKICFSNTDVVMICPEKLKLKVDYTDFFAKIWR